MLKIVSMHSILSYALLVVNPDGYAFSWSGGVTTKTRYFRGVYEEIPVEARLYRKNRRINHDGSFGVRILLFYS